MLLLSVHYNSTAFLLHTDRWLLILVLARLHLVLNDLRWCSFHLLLKRFVRGQDLVHDLLRADGVRYFTRGEFAFLVCQKVLIYWLSLKPDRLLLLYRDILVLLGRRS